MRFRARRWQPVILALALLATAAGFVSFTHPLTRTIGVAGVRLDGGVLSIAVASHALGWMPSLDRWVQNVSTAIAIAPRSHWLPSSPAASITLGTTPPVSMSLRLYCVPLAAPTVALWLGAWGATRLARRQTMPGACRACGYRLIGLTSGRCPECGTPTLRTIIACLRRARSAGVRSRTPTQPAVP